MSWLSAIGTVLVGFFSALPKILDEFSKWRQSQDTKHEEEIAAKADEAAKQTQDAKTDEDRKKVARKWADIIKSMRK